MEDVEGSLEDEELEDEAEEPRDLDGEARAPAQAPARTAVAGDEDVESIQDILVKQEARADEGEDEEDESLLTLGREERLEPLAVKVVPPQSSEFICSNCYLVRHRSQLKDKAKMLCRDCA